MNTIIYHNLMKNQDFSSIAVDNPLRQKEVIEHNTELKLDAIN